MTSSPRPANRIRAAATRLRSSARAAFALLLAFGLSATLSVGVAPERAAAESPKVFKVGSSSPPDSLSPFLAYYLSAFELVRISHDPLFRSSAENYAPEPNLATGLESNDDGTVWTITLRDDVTFSDGEPLTAEDVVWSYQANMDDWENLPGYGSAFSNYKSIKAIDEHTVELTTTVPLPENMIMANEMPILPKHVWQDRDPAKDPNTTFPWVGTGPYIVSDYKEEQYVKLVRNEHYWGEPEPSVDEIQFVFFKDPDAMVQALIKGDLDLVPGMTDAQAKSLQNNPDIEARAGTSRKRTALLLNPGAKDAKGRPIGDGHPALQDVRVRQAVHHAIDKQVLVDRVMQGAASVGEGYIPPAFSDWAWKPDDPVQFDLAEANRILDGAGYPKGDDGVRTMPDGSNPLVFRFVASSESPTNATFAEFLKEWLAEIGITVEPVLIPDSAATEQTSKAEYELAPSTWSSNPDPDFILSLQTCAESSADSFYCDEEYDRLYEQQTRELDPAKRKEIVAQLQQNLYENVPMIVVYYPKNLEGLRTDRWEPLTLQPQPDGIAVQQQGRHGYASIRPKGEPPAGEATGSMGGRDTSTNSPAIIGTVVGVIVLLAAGGGVALYLRRRRATADDTE